MICSISSAHSVIKRISAYIDIKKGRYPVALFLPLQKYYVEGITAGAVKG